MSEEKEKKKSTRKSPSTKKDESKKESTRKTTTTKKADVLKDAEFNKENGDHIPLSGEHPEAAVEPIAGLELDESIHKPITMSDLPQKERLTEKEIDALVKAEQSKIVMMDDGKKPSKKKMLADKLKKTGMITTRDL